MAAGTSASDPVPRGPVPPRGPASSRRPLVLGAAALLVALLGVASATSGDGGGGDRGLPDRLAGLPAQRGGPARDVAADLTRRLAAEPSVSGVAVGVYGEPGRTLVVLRLTPREPLSEDSATRLAARVLGGAAPREGGTGDVEATLSEDGLARTSCSAVEAGAATCVSVEAERALVVLSSRAGADPVALTQQVRDELGPAGS